MVTSQDIAWAAGFLEGEGSFTRRGTTIFIVASQVESAPVEKLARLFGGVIRVYRHRNPKHSPFHRWHVQSATARGLMMSIYGLMSPKRRRQIVAALSDWRARGRAESFRTHCPQGHEYTDENTYLNRTTNGRQCKTCRARWFKTRQPAPAPVGTGVD